VLHETLYRLHTCLDNPPYNFVIHTLPYRSESQHAQHWHIEIMPRLTQVAGFEWGSGFYINPVVPEDAARFLREAVPVPASVGPVIAGKARGSAGP
jgi:UDPglucose--hexose-1-phosphate uridylyltransferase